MKKTGRIVIKTISHTGKVLGEKTVKVNLEPPSPKKPRDDKPA